MSYIATAIHPALLARHGLDEQARPILERRLYAVFGSENADRTVHLAPVMFRLDGARILIETATPSRKARNLAARPQASVVAHTPGAAWAFGSGPATITRGAEARRLNERIRAKYLTDRSQRSCGDLLAELDDITIAVTPTHWPCWNMNALLARIAARGFRDATCVSGRRRCVERTPDRSRNRGTGRAVTVWLWSV